MNPLSPTDICSRCDLNPLSCLSESYLCVTLCGLSGGADNAEPQSSVSLSPTHTAKHCCDDEVTPVRRLQSSSHSRYTFTLMSLLPAVSQLFYEDQMKK